MVFVLVFLNNIANPVKVTDMKEVKAVLTVYLTKTETARSSQP